MQDGPHLLQLIVGALVVLAMRAVGLIDNSKK